MTGGGRETNQTQLSEWMAKRGKTTDALTQLLPTLKAKSRTAEMDYSVAIVYSLAGDMQQALFWLEKSACGGLNIARLESDPELEPLRSNSKYQTIIDKCRQSKR